ncbi:MAG: hypothetical protein QOC83_6858, partial [Pseudonocardiales bacterium]|nr:hypothetical protein [Pseudonocardiales bacterium]
MSSPDEICQLSATELVHNIRQG